MDLVRRAVTVTGRVQGVSFRYYSELQADRLGLTGWVRNAADGSVQLEVQGPPDGLESFVSWLHTGPPHAVVDHVEVAEIEPKPGETAFRVTS